MNIYPLKEKLENYNFKVHEVYGHNIEDMVEDMRRRGLVLNDNALNINSAAAQAKTGLSAEQINERVANALGIKVKSSTPKSRRYFLG